MQEININDVLRDLDCYKNFVEGKICLMAVLGSHAYGFATENSDVDLEGVFVRPLPKILSLSSHQDTWNWKNPDVTIHELRKFCSLAIKGNPTILNTLFATNHVMTTEVGVALTELRKDFLWRGSLGPYFGYANQQIRKMISGKPLHTTKNEYNNKYAAHIIRLLKAGIHLANTGEVIVRPPDADVVILKDIRTGKYSFAQILEWSQELLTELEIAKTKTQLPERPNLTKISAFLYNTYISSWTKSKDLHV